MQTSVEHNNGASLGAADLRQRSLESWRQNKLQDAFNAAWTAFDIDASRKTKSHLAKLLRYHPAALTIAHRMAYLRLLTDREVEPDVIGAAGWRLVVESYRLADGSPDAAVETLAGDLERDTLATSLLRAAPVTLAAAERLLTRLRRWLLLSRQWDHYPAVTAALKTQAGLNGGAWPFDETERACLAHAASGPMLAAYFPARPVGGGATPTTTTDPVTRAVTAQYEGWPYPAWTRITRTDPVQLADEVRKTDPALAETLPDDGKILVAGCGTGRQAASVALRFPDAAVTAIDVSGASLDYARRQCAAYGIGNVRFHQLGLQSVAELGQQFHAIYCAGVLHHLPDPECGWRALVEVLESNGFMEIMVYSRVARLMIDGARRLIADLQGQPVTDDLLREARGRFLDRPRDPLAAYVVRSRDFATLAGTHDLLLHRHEDPFDLKRIERALDEFGLRMLSFDLAAPPLEAAYDAMFPDDPAHRDIPSLIRFELSAEGAFVGNYTFRCCRKNPRDGRKA